MPKLRPPNKNDQIAQLRAQLEEEQKSSATLRKTIDTQQATIDGTLEQLKVLEQNLIQAKSTSPFLKKLPIEIRLKIYELLLVNPKLSETDSIGKAVNYGKDLKFDLTPMILCTCKAIRNEAEPILYGSNTFVLECIGGYGPFSSLHVPQSPLTRYAGPIFDDFDDDSDAEDELENNIRGYSGTEFQFDFSQFKAIKKVKHWRIITAAYRPMPTNPVPAKSFVHFCQELCQQAPTQPQRSLEIVLALAKSPESRANPQPEAQYKFSEQQLNFLLQPLSLLRDIKLVLNIAQFKTDLPIPEKLCGSCPDYYFPYSEAQTVEINLERFMNLAPPIVQKYHAIVEDLSPMEKVFKMYDRLKEYASSFERSAQYYKDLITLQRGYDANSREIRHYGWHLPRPTIGNPFKSFGYSTYHPVELAFSKAIIAKDKEDVDEFKAARASILKELEPQYRRMVDASKKLRAFVEKERGTGVFHECDGCGVFHQYEEDPYDSPLGKDLDRYIYELEKIASLLGRTMPDHIDIQVKKGATMYDSAYLHLDRERHFQKLRWMQKQEVGFRDPSLTATQISKWVKGLVEDMWAECGYSSWRRENLFKDDTTDTGCTLNQKLGAGLMDEELEWNFEDYDSDDDIYFMHMHRQVGD
ncbi:hypothetical protein NHQ30_006218 [Ciborinia camelliae]|nr:hypothetical protein NHQ30_006218 [Ciborinia camelliae]